MTPQQELDRATNAFEQAFSVHPEEGDNYYSPTGKPYVTITTGGLKEEGAFTGAFATTAAKAIALWLREIEAYADASSSKGCLYWRTRPTIETLTYFPKGKHESKYSAIDLWHVYSRLLISDKPATQSARASAA